MRVCHLIKKQMMKKTYIIPKIMWTDINLEDVMGIVISDNGATGTVDPGEYNGEFGAGENSVWDVEPAAADDEDNIGIY